MADTHTPLALRIAATRSLTPQVREFELHAEDGTPLPRFSAGAHLRFMLPNGLERCYSLVNASAQDGTYRIAVQRAPASAGGSAWLCDCAQAGTLLQAHGPKNDFALAAGARHHLLLAGGIGITPLMAMAQALDAAGQPFTLHYAARTPEAMAYRRTVQRMFGERAHLYFDDGDPRRGLPLDALLQSHAPGAHVYACGPAPMIDAVLATGARQGWPREQLHFELFASAASAAGDAAFELELARSRRTLKVGASETILDALLAHGMDPLYDCRRGECGVCAVPVLSGRPEHRDYALSAEDKAANRSMCICVSRAARGERLVLDL